MSAERRGLAIPALMLGLLAGPAQADVFAAGDFRISTGETENTYVLAARLPASAVTTLDIGWPAGCVESRAQQQVVGNQALLRFEAQCDHSLGEGDTIRTPWRLDGARLQSNLRGAPAVTTLTGSSDGMALPVMVGPRADRSGGELAPVFLWQGMLHIWLGWDHLAFVLCLCMLARGYRLLGLITTFTLGHSLSLGLAFFDVIRVPIPPVEAIIALSIVLVAREALLARGATPRGITRPMIVATAFGLVHGLGFASALGELGVSSGERGWALLFFNLGVELGQLVFVLVVLGTLALATPLRLERGLRTGSLYLAGGIGFFWAVERVAGFPWT